MSTAQNININQILKQYWGYSSFREKQDEIIANVLQGKDTLAILPTGGGKSICFQVPAMAKDGLCLVISPLIALMKDQVDNLRKKNITAFAIYSGMNRKEVIHTLELASHSNCKFLYVSPERLETTLFLEYLPSLPVNLIAVDEAHCISQWGYDFRPPYLRIANLREELPSVPILALTASATPAVQKDICEKLAFTNYTVFKKSFERANLSYSVFNAPVKINKLVEILNNVQGTSIVYCKSRKRTKDVADLLLSYGISADHYHAGLTQEMRQQRQQAWIQNKVRCIVCTNAFGMGIDKPDVRTVVHYDLPDSLENYYQEAGRAGRDGQKSYAVMLYQQKDIEDLKEAALLKFPDLQTIRAVYQAVANYLQIPTGIGEGTYYSFDIIDFAKKFQLDLILAINSLKVLEQEGYVSFNEQVFVPSKIQFICNKDTLYEFENSYPALEPFIKALLRNYEGIFDYPVSVYERSVAFVLKKTVEEVKDALGQLDRYRIIEYDVQKDSPQLYFIYERVAAQSVVIDQKQYDFRKEEYEKRLKHFIDYVVESNACRSQIVGRYFGDENISECGVCDNCLKKKRGTLSEEEFEKIKNRIFEIITTEETDIKKLISKLSGISKEKAWKVIDFLQAESKIRVTNTGIICLV